MIQYQMIIINFIVISYRKLNILYNLRVSTQSLNMMIYEFVVYIGFNFFIHLLYRNNSLKKLVRRVEMKKERNMSKDILILSATLFSMFFGAGNLIFPPSLGFEAGSKWFPALVGFFLTGTGLPLLGI